jgi:peptidoglycan hydrolase CwlO-like protein
MSTSEDVAAAAAGDAATGALLEDMEQQYLEVMQERDRLRSELEKAKSEVQQVTEKLDSQQAAGRSSLEMQQQLVAAEQKLKGVTSEKQNIQERMDRMQAEADQLREEIRYENEIFATNYISPWPTICLFA